MHPASAGLAGPDNSGRMSAAQFLVRLGWRVLTLWLLFGRLIQFDSGDHHRCQLRHCQARRLRHVRSQFFVTLLVRRLSATCRDATRLSLALRVRLANTAATPFIAARIAPMKRSRRVVLTLMGSATVGAVSMGLTPRYCGPGMEAVPGPDG